MERWDGVRNHREWGLRPSDWTLSVREKRMIASGFHGARTENMGGRRGRAGLSRAAFVREVFSERHGQVYETYPNQRSSDIAPIIFPSRQLNGRRGDIDKNCQEAE